MVIFIEILILILVLVDRLEDWIVGCGLEVFDGVVFFEIVDIGLFGLVIGWNIVWLVGDVEDVVVSVVRSGLVVFY